MLSEEAASTVGIPVAKTNNVICPVATKTNPVANIADILAPTAFATKTNEDEEWLLTL